MCDFLQVLTLIDLFADRSKIIMFNFNSPKFLPNK